MNENAVATLVATDRWKKCQTDDELLKLLGPTWTSTMIQQIPRLQFMPDDVQPPRSHIARHNLSSDVNDYQDSMPCDQEVAWHYTYAPFAQSYSKLMPLLTSDAKTEQEYQWVEPTEKLELQSAKKATLYVRAIWKCFISLLYGKPFASTYMSSIPKRMRFIANVVAYAHYYGVLDIISPSLEQMATQPNGLWKFVAENSRFSLMLGYHMKALGIYVDAVKHMVGPTLFQSSLTSCTMNRDVSDSFILPSEVTSFLLEAKSNMLADVQNKQQLFLRLIIEAVSVGVECCSISDTDLARAAQMILLQYVSGQCGGRYCYDCQFTRCKTFPERMTVLDDVIMTQDAAKLLKGLFNGDSCHTFGYSAEDLGSAIIDILCSHNIDSFLHDFCSKPDITSCRGCRLGANDDAVYDEQSNSDDRDVRKVCPVHFHKSQHFDSNIYTVLHGWGAMKYASDTDNIEYWPPASYEYYPKQTRASPSAAPTRLATPGTLAKLDLIDILMLAVDDTALAKHNIRYVSIYCRSQIFECFTNISCRRSQKIRSCDDTGEFDDSLAVLYESSTWSYLKTHRHLEATWSFSLLDDLN